MRVLVISRIRWDESNSFGNTYSNLFNGMKDIHIANVYCSFGKPNTNVVERFFCINEQDILRSIFGKSNACGCEVYADKVACPNLSVHAGNNVYRTILHLKWQIFFWIRDLIWKTGKWKSNELLEFIDSFKPDIIFSPFYYSLYMNDVRTYVCSYLGVPMVSFVSDDIYSMKQFNLSPLYWINRLLIRGKVRKTAKQCEFIYVISRMQQEEYRKSLHHDCRLLFKGANFDLKPPEKKVEGPLLIVYTGNISSGRWETLYLIGKAIQRINRNCQYIKLLVYSATPITRTMSRFFVSANAVEFKGSFPADRMKEIQSNADILLHCEPFSLRDSLQVRLSFSTKLVDYFSRRRCVLAIGNPKVASITYLVENDAAIVITHRQRIYERLQCLVHNHKIISSYAEKAWECGKRNHQISIIQKRLYNDLAKCIQNPKFGE